MKIASYDFSTTGHLLALHVLPYAAPLHPKWTSAYYEKFRDDILVHLNAYRINSDRKSNINLLKAAKPDVIIAKNEISEEEKKELSTIAKVYYYSAEDHWKKQLLEIARRIDCMSEVNYWLKQYEKKVEEAKGKIKDCIRDEKVLVISLYKDELVINRSRTAVDVLINDLEVSSPQANAEIKMNQRISLEQVGELNPCHLFINIRQDSDTLESWKKLQQKVEWLQLEAVRKGNLYFIRSDPWHEYSASAHIRVIDNIVELFKEKVHAL